MADGDPGSWLAALAALLPRRGVGRLFVTAALWLVGISVPPASDVARARQKAKRKPIKAKKRRKGCTPKCGGKRCGPDGCGKNCKPGCHPGFGCIDGHCLCRSGVVCNNGRRCCAEQQICDRDGRCCTPPSDAATCQNRCGNVINACDVPIDCGGCEERTCQTATCTAQGVCQHTNSPNNQPGVDCDGEDQVCCNGGCCSGGLVCFQGGCCQPEPESETCRGRCQTVIDNCGQEIACIPCDVQECQEGTCLPGNICDFKDTPDNMPGPFCDEPRFCCGGRCCDSDETCCAGKCCDSDEVCIDGDCEKR